MYNKKVLILSLSFLTLGFLTVPVCLYYILYLLKRIVQNRAIVALIKLFVETSGSRYNISVNGFPVYFLTVKLVILMAFLYPVRALSKKESLSCGQNFLSHQDLGLYCSIPKYNSS